MLSTSGMSAGSGKEKPVIGPGIKLLKSTQSHLM